MNIRDRQGLRQEAQNRLEQAPFDPRKLVLIHSGITAGVLLLITVINFILNNQMDSAGGLGGLGTRAILGTIQTVLETASTIAMPFWSMGYLFAVMGWMRREAVSFRTLFSGFRYLGPVLRLQLVKYLLFGGLAMICFYPAMIIFMITPLANPLVEAIEPLVTTMTDPNLLLAEPAVAAAVSKATVPMLIIFVVLFLVVAAPMFYKLRMGEFALIENPRMGAFAALRKSRRLMRGNCISLLRLDLSFWWFYVLEVLLAVVCYGDVILPILGIQLPFSSTVAFFLFYLLNLGGQVALYWWKKNSVMTTYAVAYEALDKAAPPPVMPTMPVAQNQIWKNE
jgi:uncharacterized membrane protein